jgi:hypothetical protein
MFSLPRALASIVLALALLPLAPSAAAEAAPGSAAYALVVGANRGGAGQERLRYAEQDAANVAAVLTSIGGYRAANVTRLAQPSPEVLRAALRRIEARIGEHQRRGEKSSFLFYYSGHARTQALNLADAELPLADLRRALDELPATLKIVILDACQSGAFSRVKGVSGAADFSVNSIASLNAAGMAVMASSSASELSQESERLGSSYFTHYLLVALRGAGDDNRDGRVTLDEAYRYAYNRTLAATAATAVGKQHVTLETDLRGKGEIPLSFPSAVRSALLLPRAASGEYLVQARASGAVLAEVHKVPDRSIRIALAPGAYRVMIRRGGRAEECDASVAPGQTTVFRGAGCREVALDEGVAKGRLMAPTWGLEAALGFSGGGVEDGYTDRLSDFGYRRQIGLFDSDPHLELTVTRYLGSRVHLAATYLSLASDDYVRDGDTEIETFEWGAAGLVAAARITYPMLWEWPSGRPGGIIPFAEAGAGVSYARSQLRIGGMDSTDETHWGYIVSAAAGGQLMLIPAFGFYAKVRYAVAPTLENLLGDTHDVGGVFASFGLRTTF